MSNPSTSESQAELKENSHPDELKVLPSLIQRRDEARYELKGHFTDGDSLKQIFGDRRNEEPFQRPTINQIVICLSKLINGANVPPKN